MCHQSVYRGSGVSEQKFISLSQPKALDHFCLACGCKLTPGTHHKQPNQYDPSNRKKVLACTGCGSVFDSNESQFWENHDKEGIMEVHYALVFDHKIPYPRNYKGEPNPQVLSGDLHKHEGFDYVYFNYDAWGLGNLPGFHDIVLAKEDTDCRN